MRMPLPGSLNISEFIDGYEAAIGRKLNSEQRQAVKHGKGPLYVMAGPGSGKSEVMVARAIKLVLVDGAQPESVFVTSFTRKAARNLEDRIADRLLRMGYDTTLDGLRIGTLHGLCDQIMRQYRWPEYHGKRLLNELEQAFLVYRSVDDLIEEEDADLFWSEYAHIEQAVSSQFGPNKWQRAAIALKLLNRIADEHCDLVKLGKARKKQVSQLAGLTIRYREKLRSENAVDYSVLQNDFLDFLSSPVGRSFLGGDRARGLAPLKYVLVDEYQDTNPVQEAIYVELAKQAGGNITVVGDDDQALYRFRGATVECLIRFPELCTTELGKTAKSLQLQTNYRSLPSIIQWSEKIISGQPAMHKPGARAPKKPMVSARAAIADFEPVGCIGGQRAVDAADGVAQTIKQLIDRGLVDDPSQIAILLRSAKESPRNAGPVAEALRELSVPVYNPRSKAFLEAEEVAGMIGALITVLDPEGLVSDQVRGRAQESIAQWRERFEDLANAHPQLSTYVGRVQAAIEKKEGGEYLNISLRDLFYRFLALEPFRTWSESASTTFRLGQLSAIIESFAADSNDSLRKSKEDGGGISETWLRAVFYPRFIGYLHRADLDDPDDVDYEIRPGAVQIMTVHQSKGLEFPVVFVGSVDKTPSATDTTYGLEELLARYSQRPRQLAPTDDRATQDLVRFYYVAYTRAQNLLILFGTQSHFAKARVAVGECS